MNCQQCQCRLLESLDPDSPGTETEAHLAECAPCREWRRRLSQIESNVTLLPVPSSQSRPGFLNEFLRGPSPTATLPGASPVPQRWTRWRVLATASGGLAAAAVLITCGILLGNWLSRSFQDRPIVLQAQKNLTEDKPSPLAKPLAEQMIELDMQLAQGDSPRQRLETLAKLAQSLQGESRALAEVAEPKDLQALARLYGKVVNDGIVARARKLPAGQRRQALDPIVVQLARANRETEELARKASPASAAPLQQIAATARTGDVQLRALMEEDTP